MGGEVLQFTKKERQYQALPFHYYFLLTQFQLFNN